MDKVEKLLFEVYDKGLQQEDCDLTNYSEKIKSHLRTKFSNLNATFCPECGKETLVLQMGELVCKNDNCDFWENGV